MFGTAAFFPRLLTDLLSDTHPVSREACILQAFVIYSYASNENTILMLMAFDRYVAISKPLQYNNIMTPRILSVLIDISWIYPMICIGIAGILNARLTMCGNKLVEGCTVTTGKLSSFLVQTLLLIMFLAFS